MSLKSTRDFQSELLLHGPSMDHPYVEKWNQRRDLEDHGGEEGEEEQEDQLIVPEWFHHCAAV